MGSSYWLGFCLSHVNGAVVRRHVQQMLFPRGSHKLQPIVSWTLQKSMWLEYETHSNCLIKIIAILSNAYMYLNTLYRILALIFFLNLQHIWSYFKTFISLSKVFNEIWNIFLANNRIKHFLRLFNRTNKIMIINREVFLKYPIIKHYGLINFTLKTMGEVIF